MKDFSKIFKYLMWLLFAVSVGIIVWGAWVGYPTTAAEPDKGTVTVLLYWVYAMIGLGVLCAVVFGLAVAIANNPKSLINILVGILVAVAVCGIAYLVAPASPAIGMLEQPTHGILKLTDTILYIVAFFGVLAVLAIIFGEVWNSVRNK